MASKIKVGLLIYLFTIIFNACKDDAVKLGTQVSELFYVESEGAKMPVLVEGNTASKVLIVFVHGGPGGTAIGFQNDAYISKYLEQPYAVAYWDQRAAGGSQGSFTPKLKIEQYANDLKKVIQVLKFRYGSDSKVFLLAHSFGGLVAPAFLTDGNNQEMVQGWINIAGAHNYILNDSLTRAYLISFGKSQIAAGIHASEWQTVVDDAEKAVPDFTLKTSRTLNLHASEVEAYIDDIETIPGTGIKDFLLGDKEAFSLFWTLSNAGSTVVSDFPKDLMYCQYSDKLHLIKLPLICITGKYDFTVPRGLADEVMTKAGSVKKNLVILNHSGHICMNNEPDLLYENILKFIKENL
jgi:pimeloyl-ACP methyl ester carboxylesterase